MTGMRLIPKTDHRIEPVKDSWYTRLGKPAKLLNTAHYPIEAVCLECSRPIVVQHFLGDWTHFEHE